MMATFVQSQRTLYMVALELTKQEILEMRELFARAGESLPGDLGDTMFRAFTIPETTIKDLPS